MNSFECFTSYVDDSMEPASKVSVLQHVKINLTQAPMESTTDRRACLQRESFRGPWPCGVFRLEARDSTATKKGPLSCAE